MKTERDNQGYAEKLAKYLSGEMNEVESQSFEKEISDTGENKYIIRLYNKTTHPHDIAYKLLKDGQQIFQNKITINK